MRLQLIPSVARFKSWALAVSAHSRGAAGVGGHFAFERGPGARVTGSIELTQLSTTHALKLRAWLHSMRGRSGTFYMPAPNRELVSNPCSSPTAQFGDCTGFSDGTTFSDLWAGYTTHATDASAAAGAASISLASAGSAAVGDWLLVGGQLVRIVSVSGGTIGIRPRLRSAVASGAAVYIGPVYALFRILEDAPIVPLVPGRSREFSIDIEEAY